MQIIESEFEQLLKSIHKTFSIVRLFSIIILIYVWIFEAFKPGERPTITYTFLLASTFIISIPFSNKIKILKAQFVIALIVYSTCTTFALAYRGGIYTITIALLYPLLALLSAFLLSPMMLIIISMIIIIEYIF